MPIVVLNEAELEEQFDRSSGPGGQNVNKVSTKVTLRHIPTSISVTVQDTRSQAQNRQLARERLLKALNDRQSEAAAALRQEREKKKRRNRKRPRGLQEKILKSKKHRGKIKMARRSVIE